MSFPEPAPSGRALRLADALAVVGVAVDVEADGAVAILVERADAPAVDWRARRAEVVRIAQAHGFRSVALDLARPSR